MPCYEYECRGCKERFEVECRMEDRERNVDCPLCGRRDGGVRYYGGMRWRWSDGSYGLPAGMSNADAMSVTERAKKERGVWKGK